MICKRTQPVLVFKERKSRFVIAAKLAGKSAAGTAKAIMREPGVDIAISFRLNFVLGQ